MFNAHQLSLPQACLERSKVTIVLILVLRNHRNAFFCRYHGTLGFFFFFVCGVTPGPTHSCSLDMNNTSQRWYPCPVLVSRHDILQHFLKNDYLSYFHASRSLIPYACLCLTPSCHCLGLSIERSAVCIRWSHLFSRNN